MGFSRQECWSGTIFSPSGELPDSGIDSFALQADSLPLSHLGSIPKELIIDIIFSLNIWQNSSGKAHEPEVSFVGRFSTTIPI